MTAQYIFCMAEGAKEAQLSIHVSTNDPSSQFGACVSVTDSEKESQLSLFSAFETVIFASKHIRYMNYYHALTWKIVPLEPEDPKHSFESFHQNEVTKNIRKKGFSLQKPTF